MIYVPKSGATMTDTAHDSNSAIATTQNMSRQNSLATPFENATGMKPAQVISVPVSIGLAVTLNAWQAASNLDSPRSSCTLIISTAIIASSTKSPSAIISEPSDTLCKSIPSAYMKQNVPANTSGIQPATTSPVRTPKLAKLTPKTITIANRSVSTNSPIDSSTTCG